MADRIQARFEEYAPGFGDRVLARRVLGPRELQERDESLRGGALNGGTGALTQQLVLRPVPGLGGARTPVRGLYLASASAHPGGGVHGACGANAAHAALRARAGLARDGSDHPGADLRVGPGVGRAVEPDQRPGQERHRQRERVAPRGDGRRRRTSAR